MVDGGCHSIVACDYFLLREEVHFVTVYCVLSGLEWRVKTD